MSKRLIHFLLDEIRKARAEIVALEGINKMLNKRLKELKEANDGSNL